MTSFDVRAPCVLLDFADFGSLNVSSHVYKTILCDFAAGYHVGQRTNTRAWSSRAREEDKEHVEAKRECVFVPLWN